MGYVIESDQQIWLMTLYGKDEAADLTPKEKKALKAAMELELNMRAEKPAARRGKWRAL